MCGIAGYIGPRVIDQERIERTLHLMRNRGPDWQAGTVKRAVGANVYLLHSRLSIIDLDRRAHQPMRRDHVTVVYNGEIYNYGELRAQLQRRGWSFSTDSDTEVLVRAYEAWGDRCVERFEGMWAFALWDDAQQVLLLSRDRFAEKPLYYVANDGGLYFGSEIKYLKSLIGSPLTVNTHLLLRYLVLGYKALYKTGETFYQEVREVPYATTVTVAATGEASSQQYWQPRYTPVRQSREAAVAAVKAALREAVRLRLRADVPLAFCLSGGVDSAGLVSLAAKELGCPVTTFSIIDPDERYNERDNILATVKDVGAQHTEVVLQRSADLLDDLRGLIAYHDAPIATITYYIHSLLTRAMARAGYRVAISGTAADELFTGYFDHWLWCMIELQGTPAFDEVRRGWEQYVRPFVRNPYLTQLKHYLRDPGERRHIYLHWEQFAACLRVDFRAAFTEERFTTSVLRNRMLNELFHEATRVILHEDDLNAMRYSIENRSPYLDTRLFTAAYSIPPELLMRDGYAKSILRDALKGVLNDAVRLDRRKRGFNASIQSLLDLTHGPGREWILSDSPIYDLVERPAIERYLTNAPLPNSVSKFLFNFINAKLFLERALSRAPVTSPSPAAATV